jgi:hypothetical protein
MMARAEQLGEEGKIDESMEVLRRVEVLKHKKPSFEVKIKIT